MSTPRIMFLWVMWTLIRWPSVVLVDFDGAAHARLVKGSRTFRVAARHGLGVRTVRLLDDGTATGASYVKGWEPLFPSVSPPQTPGIRVMADIIKQVFSVAEAKRQAKIYQSATKAMAEHCDERIADATKALKAIRKLANGPGDRRAVIDKIFGIATEAVRELNPRSDREKEQ